MLAKPMAKWMKNQLILILSLTGVVLFSSSSFAGDQDSITLCEEILSGIQKRHRGLFEQSQRNGATIENLHDFKVAHLNLPADPKNELVNSDSGSDLQTRSATAARVEAVFADARENIHSIAADYVQGDDAIQALVDRNLRDVIYGLERGSWTFRSMDFRVSPAVFSQFIASGHWPRNSRENIEVVTPDGNSFSRFRFLVSDVFSFGQDGDDRRTAWIHLDTLAYRHPQTGEPMLIDIVRYHSETPQYGAGGGRRANSDRKEELEEFLDLARKEGRAPIRASGIIRRQH